VGPRFAGLGGWDRAFGVVGRLGKKPGLKTRPHEWLMPRV